MPSELYQVNLSHPAPPASTHGGSGSPEGVIPGSPFATWVDTDSDTLYVKVTGAGTTTGWAQVSGGVASGTGLHQGTGSPEGVVTASVGELYLDTAAVAIYAKVSGAGNTGWQVMVS